MNYSTRADIQEVQEAFAARRPAAMAEFGGLDPIAFNWQPDEGRWSVAQCLEHLNLTGLNWAHHLGPVLWKAMRSGVHHRGPHRPGPVGRKAIAAMETVSQRLKAPSLFEPAARTDYDLHDVFCAFNAAGESWEATLRRACLLNTSALRVSSPAAAWMRAPLGTWLFALSAHEDRHLAQARVVTTSPDFPG